MPHPEDLAIFTSQEDEPKEKRDAYVDAQTSKPTNSSTAASTSKTS